MTPAIPSVAPMAAPQGGGLSVVAASRSVPPVAAVTHDAPDSQQNLDAALKQFERAAHEAGAALDFRIDEDSQRLVVSVVDRGSGEVLRQIPSEEALRIARHLQGLQERSGALIAAVA